MSSHKSSRVKFNPDIIPEGRSSSVSKSSGMRAKENYGTESREIRELSDKISRLIRSIEKIDDRVSLLEKSGTGVESIKRDIEDIKGQMAINDFAINSDDHLRDYLIDIKDQEMIEAAVTGREIEKKAEKLNSRRKNRR